MDWTPEQVEVFRHALLQNFDVRELEELAWAAGLGGRAQALTGQPLQAAVSRLISQAAAVGALDRLLSLALRQRRGQPQLFDLQLHRLRSAREGRRGVDAGWDWQRLLRDLPNAAICDADLSTFLEGIPFPRDLAAVDDRRALQGVTRSLHALAAMFDPTLQFLADRDVAPPHRLPPAMRHRVYRMLVHNEFGTGLVLMARRHALRFIGVHSPDRLPHPRSVATSVHEFASEHLVGVASPQSPWLFGRPGGGDRPIPRRFLVTLLDGYAEALAQGRLTPMPVLVQPRPALQWTCTASPAVAIGPAGGGAGAGMSRSKSSRRGTPNPGPLATVGVFASDGHGNIGVTTAYHALSRAGKCGRGTRWTVGSATSVVRSLDPISDSCFLALPDADTRALDPFALRPRKGFIGFGDLPGPGEPLTFEGITSGVRSTRALPVVDPAVSFPSPGIQVRVYTTADTSPGDSGAALVDSRDRVVGFSAARTPPSAAFECSIWIHAASVLRAHGITLLATAGVTP